MANFLVRLGSREPKYDTAFNSAQDQFQRLRTEDSIGELIIEESDAIEI